jgi:hypothetical protein
MNAGPDSFLIQSITCGFASLTASVLHGLVKPSAVRDDEIPDTGLVKFDLTTVHFLLRQPPPIEQ